MTLETELFEIEEGLWLEGEQHFLDHVDAQCLLAFPQAGEIHGVHSRTEVAGTATKTNRWRDLTMTDRRLLHSGDDVAIISDKADVTRADGQPYAAMVSSAYSRRPDGWKLAFHQHSPT